MPKLDKKELHYPIDIPLLDVNNLSVKFSTQKGHVQAINKVSFHLNKSETLAILGESGSGKSTIALAIMGLLPEKNAFINNGVIKYKDQDLIKLNAVERRKLRGSQMSMIFQDPLSALNPVYTVGFQIGEIIRTHERLPRKLVKQKVIDLMKKVRIPDAEKRVNDYPHQFSGGMQQRIMIAIALALNPRFLIADEPTTALDVTVQNQIMHLLKELQKANDMGLIFISHDIGVVANFADRVAVMYGGHIVETGMVDIVLKNPAHPYTKGLIKSLPSTTHDSTRLIPIDGSPPNLIEPPAGCPFEPRCPMARDVCKVKKPPLVHITDSRESACHFYEEVLMNGEK